MQGGRRRRSGATSTDDNAAYGNLDNQGTLIFNCWGKIYIRETCFFHLSFCVSSFKYLRKALIPKIKYITNNTPIKR